MKLKHLCLALLLLSFLWAAAACARGSAAPPPEGEAGVSEESSSIKGAEEEGAPSPDGAEQTDLLLQMQALYQQLDTSRLPLEKHSYWYEADESSLGELPRQLLFDSPEAYRYMQLIRNYLSFHGSNLLDDFEDVQNLGNTYSVLQTAIEHTTPIEWRWATIGGIRHEYKGPFDNHLLSALMKNEAEEGRGLCDLYYADDVQATIRKMFGSEANVRNSSLPQSSYIYYPREGVYGRVGDFGGPWKRYPMLTAMEATENSMVCEILLVWGLDRDTPCHLPGFDELTAENFKEAAASQKKYRYTFVEDPQGSPILASLQTLQPEALD